jgi:hypothetical protein
MDHFRWQIRLARSDWMQHPGLQWRGAELHGTVDGEQSWSLLVKLLLFVSTDAEWWLITQCANWSVRVENADSESCIFEEGHAVFCCSRIWLWLFFFFLPATIQILERTDPTWKGYTRGNVVKSTSRAMHEFKERLTVLQTPLSLSLIISGIWTKAQISDT